MRKNCLRFGTIFVVIAVLLIWFTPVMAAEKTEYTCDIPVLSIINPGSVTTPDGNVHIRGMVGESPMLGSDPRTAGFGTIVLNLNLRKDGSGPQWGTFHIEVGEDGWEGTWAGLVGQWYNGVGKGFGEFSGMKMWMHVNFINGTCSGTILEH